MAMVDVAGANPPVNHPPGYVSLDEQLTAAHTQLRELNAVHTRLKRQHHQLIEHQKSKINDAPDIKRQLPMTRARKRANITSATADQPIQININIVNSTFQCRGEHNSITSSLRKIMIELSITCHLAYERIPSAIKIAADGLDVSMVNPPADSGESAQRCVILSSYAFISIVEQSRWVNIMID
jgi:hypothetical protein